LPLIDKLDVKVFEDSEIEQGIDLEGFKVKLISTYNDTQA